MAGGGLSREILVSYVVISTSPTTNELYTTGRTAVIFVGHLWPSIFLNKCNSGCRFLSDKKQDCVSHTGINNIF